VNEGRSDPQQQGSAADCLRHWWRDNESALVPVLLAAVTLAWLLLLFGRWGFDDPYVTYRYADNLLTGKGLVYNAGERTLSTVAPLYALLLAALGNLWPDVPRLSNFIGLISLVASALVLMRWGKRGQESGGMIAGLLLGVWPLMLQTSGLERTLLMLLMLVGFHAVERSRLTAASGTLALAGILRPEGLLAGAVAGVAILLRRRTLPWRAALLYLVPVAVWYCALWINFGSPLPVNLAAKQQQAQMLMGTDFVSGFLQLLRQYGRHPLYWLHGALALFGLAQVVVRARHWGLLLAWTALYFLGYSLLGVSRYFWFYAPLVPAVAVLVGEGVVGVVGGLRQLRIPHFFVAGSAGLLIVCLLAPPLASTVAMAWRPDPRLDVYRQIGEWLRSETPPEATVGTLEVGIIGYYSQRTMIDFSGLVQPEVAQQLASAGTYEGSTKWAIERFWPDYVVLDRAAFPRLPATDWFGAAYSPARSFAGLENLWLTVYERTETQ